MIIFLRVTPPAESTSKKLASTAPDSPRGRGARRYAVLAMGYALVGAGAAMLVLPGPGVPVLLGGLAVLGREQAWARRLQERIRERLARALRRSRTDPA